MPIPEHSPTERNRRPVDTKYLEQALIEYCLQRSAHIKLGDLTTGELSRLLRRAQELKAADKSPESRAERERMMERMGV